MATHDPSSSSSPVPESTPLASSVPAPAVHEPAVVSSRPPLPPITSSSVTVESLLHTIKMVVHKEVAAAFALSSPSLHPLAHHQRGLPVHCLPSHQYRVRKCGTAPYPHIPPTLKAS